MMGLRERKKEQTRRLITETAWRLFTDRGFDHVTVAEVAREAQVALATVFNYFPTKEDLFYSRLEAFETRLLEAVSAREAGEPVLVAFRRHLLEPGGLLARADAGDPDALEQLRTVNRMIATSPALLARERQTIARYADSLAELLAAETGAPPTSAGSASRGSRCSNVASATTPPSHGRSAGASGGSCLRAPRDQAPVRWRAWSRSARSSAASSMPTESRTMPGLMPARSSSRGV